MIFNDNLWLFKDNNNNREYDDNDNDDDDNDDDDDYDINCLSLSNIRRLENDLNWKIKSSIEVALG